MDKFFDLDNSMNALSKGAFLVSGDDKPNVMTIAWGMIGVMWFKKVMMVPVRETRFTKEFIDKTGTFTVCVPYGDASEALKICGSKSGRDVDKFELTGMKPAKAKSVNSHIIEGCNMYYECKVLYKSTLNKEDLLPNEAKCYENNNMHTMYFAEIVDSYTK